MKLFLIAAVIAVGLFFIIRNSGKKDPVAEACAKEVIHLLRQKKDASAQDIAEVYARHERTKENIDQVTRLIHPRLRQAQILKEEHPEVMRKVRQAKDLLGR